MSTNQYGGFLTDKGAAKQVEAASGGLRRNITHMLIGDAGGAPGQTPDPVGTQPLANQARSAALSGQVEPPGSR
ncbi:phage tail protein [Pseudomonas aeruginosa]|uniref:phage tail-collar fiber domain-containing protein n=1 Tax=Pseudomonas aeruginosa TaxID=287 RepID=UPI0023AA72D9|nr:phage tail protein [Pseudomonas aeruginosa]